MKKGIAVAGNILADIVKTIDGYPPRGNLCNIRSAEEGFPPVCAETVLTLEHFTGTADNIYDSIEKVAASVDCWRRFLGKCGYAPRMKFQGIGAGRLS
ncbi:hypothetical protein FACS1894211_04060 [Clostridia bacterium]|nr:hypothetical protein FACS1894211_04060 [Clostridia bacterium]